MPENGSLDEILKQIRFDGTIPANDGLAFVRELLFGSDNAAMLNEFREEFKIKYIAPLSKQIKNIKDEDLKQIFDPFGISSMKNLKDDVKKVQDKLKKLLKLDLPDDTKDNTPVNKIKNTKTSDVLKEKTTIINESKNQISSLDFSAKSITELRSLISKVTDSVSKKKDLTIDFSSKVTTQLTSLITKVTDKFKIIESSNKTLNTILDNNKNQLKELQTKKNPKTKIEPIELSSKFVTKLESLISKVSNQLKGVEKSNTILEQLLERSKQQDDGEQKNIEPEVTVVEFSEKTNLAFHSMFEKFGDLMSKNFEKVDKDEKKIEETLKDILVKAGKEHGSGIGLIASLFGGGPLMMGTNLLKAAIPVVGVFGGIAALVYGLQTDGPFKGLAKLASRGLLEFGKIGGAIEKMLGGFVESLIELPKNLIKNFGKVLFGFGKETGFTALKTGINTLKGFIPKFLATALKTIKGVPLIGGLISLGFAISRFTQGDILGGGIDVLAGLASTFLPPGVGTVVSLALDGLNAFLDFKAGGAKEGGKKAGVVGNWIKDFTFWIGRKIGDLFMSLPVIGPTIKAISAFHDNKFLEGIKQIAYILPPFEVLGALLGDKQTGAVSKGIAGGINILGKVIKWVDSMIYKSLKLLPYIGPALRAGEEFIAGNFLSGIKQLAYIFPPFEWIGSLLGDKDVSFSAKVVTAPVKILGKIIEFVAVTIKNIFKNIPVIGPAIKGIGEIVDGNFLKGIKQFAYIFTPFELLGALLGDKDVGAITNVSANGYKNIGSIIGGLVTWVGKTLYNVIRRIPVIGPLISSLGNFVTGNWKAGLKDLSRVTPESAWVYDLLTEAMPTETNTDGQKKFSFGSLFQNIKTILLKRILSFIPESVLGVSVRSRVADMLGINLGPVNDNIESDKNKEEEISKKIEPVKNLNNKKEAVENKSIVEETKKIETKPLPVIVQDYVKNLKSKMDDNKNNLELNAGKQIVENAPKALYTNIKTDIGLSQTKPVENRPSILSEAFKGASPFKIESPKYNVENKNSEDSQVMKKMHMIMEKVHYAMHNLSVNMANVQPNITNINSTQQVGGSSSKEYLMHEHRDANELSRSTWYDRSARITAFV